MILFALFACLFSTFQIFIVATLGRSISARYCVAGFLAGMAASFAMTLLAELAVTSLATGETGVSFREVVRSASYGVDPLVEEFCKLLPLLGVILIARIRRSLGAVDIILISASLGAGFGFMESALSLGSVSSLARWMSHFLLLSGGGFGMSQLAVPDPWATVTSWLPNPTNVLGPMDDPAVILNFHVAYSIFAGIGLAVIVKAPRLWWVWAPALAYAVLDHIGFNAEAARTELPLFLTPVLQALRPFDGLLVLVAIIGATVADRRTFKRALARNEPLKLAGEGADGRAAARLAFGNLRNVGALRMLWRFTLERRGYLTASAADDQGDAQAALGKRLEAFAQSLRIDGDRQSSPPAEAAEAAPAPRRIGRRLLTMLAIALAVPPILYWAAVGFVPPGWLAGLFGSAAIFAGLIGLTVAGVLLQLGMVVAQLRALLSRRDRPGPRAALWHALSLQTALGGIALGVLVLSVSIGQDPLQPIGAAHALERWLGAHPIAALMLAVMVAVLSVVVPMAVIVFLPRVGAGIGIVQAITGIDAMTGQRLTFLERVSGLLSRGQSRRVSTGPQGVRSGPYRIAAAEASFSYGTKINRQLARRGWDNGLIDSTIARPHATSSALNRVSGSEATAYFNRDGSYVIRDNTTHQIIQVSNRNEPHWVPDPSITNPYRGD